jgi:hypothetical protein
MLHTISIGAARSLPLTAPAAYSMLAIADHFGVGRMTVSRAVKRSELAAVRANGTGET